MGVGAGPIDITHVNKIQAGLLTQLLGARQRGDRRGRRVEPVGRGIRVHVPRHIAAEVVDDAGSDPAQVRVIIVHSRDDERGDLQMQSQLPGQFAVFPNVGDVRLAVPPAGSSVSFDVDVRGVQPRLSQPLERFGGHVTVGDKRVVEGRPRVS
jgi:hypothetical protein